MSKAARIRYLADGDYVDKKATEFSLTQEVIEKLDSIEPSAERNAIQGIKVNGQVVEPDQYRVVSLAIPEVEDNLDSISSTNALSAKQGRVLYNRIKNLEGLGKFLSNWDSSTGMPTSNPTTLPYEYHSGDYYIVGRVGATNYRPDGTSYRGIPSTVVESEEVKVGDFYFFNGSIWELLLNTDRQIPIDESLSTTSTNPVENRVVTAALNLKANDADISVVGKTNDFNDLDNIPNIPDSLDDLTGTSDDITEGNTHLFLTTAERTKLANTTGVNTGDETNASIMSKLGAASSTTNGYLTVADWNTFNNKQGAISDLETIRSNASAGKSASDIIATYGDIVTHDANEFATATQGGKADTALQPGDNVSELTNDAGYITDAYHDSTKQDKLIAGSNIQIAADGKTISATDTTYVAGDFDIKDLADSTGLRAEWSGKQDALTAGNNIQISGSTISATDTTYSAGAGISISNNNVISAIDNKASWGSIEGTLSNQTDLQSALDDKQGVLTAGANIQIAQDGTISATDTTYTAGTGIDITNGVISNTQTSAEWGNISGTLSDQTDLQSALDAKQDNMVILSYGNSTWDDFITAYQKNGVVYCRASSQTNPATGSQTRLAFMAYVNNETAPTEVEFQYYRSRADHNSAANQLDQVFVYKLTSNGTWTVTERNTAAKATAGSGINLTYGSGNMTISNSGVTSVNGDTGDVTLTIPTVPTNVSDFVNDAGYITANDLPTIDTAMSDGSTNPVQNKVIKSYVDTQVQEATAGAVSDTAYGSSWDGITGIAPSKNAVYDKISAMDTTIAGKQATISDLSTIRSGASKGATAVQPGDNVSTLTNDSGFITKAVSDLTNYYTKSETYTKAEVADYVANFSGFDVVATLPTTDIKTTIIYLLGPVGTGADKYEEYIYSNNTWIKIGDTSIDLSPYFNKNSDTSDAITQGSTNLFLTSAERTKLSNTSGTNTGDETKATIQSKLGAASSSASGYLTSTDWNTFNNKQKALTAGSNIQIANDGTISATDTTYVAGDFDIKDLSDSTSLRNTWSGKQDALTTQTAYTSKGSATKVPQITTNTLGQVTGITEVDITHPSQIDNTAYGTSWNGVTDKAPTKDAVYDKISTMDTAIAGKQATISDLATIRSGAAAGATAVQPGDNISTLNNDTGYITNAYHDSTKQDKLTAGENIKISSNVISANNVFIITEADVTVSTDDTKGVAPYNTNYGYTNIDISANAGIEWREGAIYTFVVDTEMVVASAYRNVRVKIGTGAYIPVMGSSTIVAGHSYFAKNQMRQFQYSTKYESGGALHLFSDSNTTYSAMSASEATTGTATTARTISASVLKGAIQTHSPVQSVNGQTGAVTLTIPTVNNGTLTINQGGTSKGTFTANQSGASTVNLETGKLVTQTEYNNISGASSDGNLYIIYKTV